MAKITRANQKIFASTSGIGQLGVFGSLASGSPAYSTNPETIQSLSNYLDGWYAAVLGENSPAIQDMNSLFYLFAYQLSYIFQNGIPEWNSATTYYVGSLCTSGNFTYRSIADDNLNNAVTNTTYWVLNGNRIRTTTTTDTATLNDNFIKANPTSGAFTQTLPISTGLPVGFELGVKNIATNGNAVTVSGGANLIDGAASFVLNSDTFQESATFKWDGSAWMIK